MFKYLFTLYYVTHLVPNTGEITVNFVSCVLWGKGAMMPIKKKKKKSILTLFAGELVNEIIAVGYSKGLLNHILGVIQRQLKRKVNTLNIL